MPKFYVGDTPLIRASCGTDVSTAILQRILYWKPNGASGYWNASAYQTTYLQYQSDVTNLDIAGGWKFASFVTLSGGMRYTGETFTQQIFERGR